MAKEIGNATAEQHASDRWRQTNKEYRGSSAPCNKAEPTATEPTKLITIKEVAAALLRRRQVCKMPQQGVR